MNKWLHIASGAASADRDKMKKTKFSTAARILYMMRLKITGMEWLDLGTDTVP